ncbi:hypothetical protein I4U23_005186 [Adineta vaga]|nr:hypothetical protein I4U23_005186 [Adineta vaga]
MKILKSYLLIVLLLNITSWVSATSLFSRVKTSKGENFKKAVTYESRDLFYALDDPSVNRATSEHFQIIWGNNDTSGTVNLTLVEGNLKNLEGIRSFYIDVLGFGDIGYAGKPSLTGLYKSNLYIALIGLEKIYDGWAYVGTDSDGCAYQVMMPGALHVNPPSWVPPHELGHVFVFHNRGAVPYVWGESVANYLRHEYLGSDYYSFGGTVYVPDAYFFPAYLLSRESHFPSGLGHQALLNIFTSKLRTPTYFDTISNVTGVSIKEILVPGHSEKTYTTLTNASDGWMVVPDDKAPQQAGHNVIPLGSFPNKSSITVNFQGTSTATGADWRVSIVTATADRTSRYSSMWNSGTNTMNLQGDEKAVYLVVTATPSSMPFIDLGNNGIKFPYKIQVTSQ